MQSKHFCKLGNNSVTTLATNPHRSTATAALKSSRRGSFVDESKRSPKMSKLGQVSLSLSLSLSVDEHRSQTRHLLSKRGRCPTGRVAGARSMADPKLFLQKKKKPNRIRKTISLKVEPFWISGKGDDSAVANVIDVVELRTRFSLNFFLFWLGNFSRFLRVLGGGGGSLCRSP